MRPPAWTLPITLASIASLSAFGCARGCARDRPYAPYAIDGGGEFSGAAASGAPGSGPAGDDAGVEREGDAAFVHVLAEKAPVPDAGSWELAGMALTAPAGASFVTGLAVDLDGDGVRDAVAWASAGEGAPGQLLFFKGSPGAPTAAPRIIAALPPLLADGAGCQVDRRLEQVGAHSVAMRVATTCVPRPPVGARVQWIAVATLTGEPALRQTVLLAAPRDGEQLSADVDASDADGDGRDDLVLTFALEGGAPPFEPAPRVSANLRWFDRPAGLSRDPGEPEGSLRRAAGAELKRAAKKSEAPRAALAAQRIAQLAELLCSDAPDRWIAVSSGPLACMPSRAVEDAVAAEVKARLTEGDVLRAVGAADRIGWRQASLTRDRRAEIDKWILHGLSVMTPATVRTLRSVPVMEPVPSWGPLTFEPAGPLLVRAREGVVVAQPDTGDEQPVQGIPAWPGAVNAGPSADSRWIGVVDPGDGFALRARFSKGEALLPIWGRAAGHPPSSDTGAMSAVPVGLSPQGLSALVAGAPLLFSPDLLSVKETSSEAWAAQPANAGSPRSPDGKSFAVGTRLGVLVRTPKGWELWRPPDQEAEFQELRACTVANGARAVACVRGGKVLIMGRPESG